MKTSILAGIVMLMAVAAFAEPVRTTNEITFTWEAITHYEDGTEITALGGYALYRSRVPARWDALNNRDQAYIVVEGQQTTLICNCPDEGLWYWTLRVFDGEMIFSPPSNQMETIVDVNFKTTPLPPVILEVR